MIKQSSFRVAVLALATIAIASAKTYNVTLTEPMKVGNLQLTPGDYKLKVEGANAVFTEAETHQSVTVPVKIETSDRKYERTEVDSAEQNGADQIKSIGLGGSKTKLEFGQ